MERAEYTDAGSLIVRYIMPICAQPRRRASAVVMAIVALVVMLAVCNLPQRQVRSFDNQVSGTADADGEDPKKQKCEMDWWRTKYAAEGGKLKNDHYEAIYTKYFDVSSDVYAGMKVLDLGCGPRGSVEWMTNAKARVCVDPLADQYGGLGANEHDMVRGYYVYSGT